MSALVEAGFRSREKRYDLKTLEGGWVKLKRMNHGHSNELTDLRLSFEASKEGSGKATISTKVGRHFAFEHSIVDHNLGSDGKKYDFARPEDVDALDPNYGDEISDLIDSHQELVSGSELPNS